jgi:hypothetical protein
MSEKSHVTMEAKICIVCCCQYSTGAIMLDRRLRQIFDRDTVVGWGICPTHEKDTDNDRIALIEMDEAKSSNVGNKIKPEDAYRTGNVVIVSRASIAAVMTTPVPNSRFMFVAMDVFKRLFPDLDKMPLDEYVGLSDEVDDSGPQPGDTIN